MWHNVSYECQIVSVVISCNIHTASALKTDNGQQQETQSQRVSEDFNILPNT